MDRARAAGYIDNNFVQNQQRIKKRKDHLARIKKIMNRKPGTSVTLDNTPPIVQQATADDPRKKAKKGLFSVIIERENKVLLQRISAILTEPARNTVKEYDAMKKLIVPKNQGNARAYDAHMQKLRNDKFFSNLRNQKPVYSVKAWEKDYEHQKYNQRFMREVSYKRPPGFVDPFAPSSSEQPRRGSKVPKQETNGGVGSKSPGKDSLSSAHVNRVRNIKSERPSISKSAHSKGSKNGINTNTHNHHKLRSIDSLASGRSSGEGSRERHRVRGESDAEDAQFYDGDDFEEEGEEGFADEDEFKELLAEVHRDIRVSEETTRNEQHRNQRNHGQQYVVGGSEELKLSVYLANAEVRCWLVNGDVIVLSAMLTEEDGRSLAAEAEMSLEDLAVLRGEDPSLLGGVDGAGTTGSGGRDDPPQEGASSVFSHTFDLPMLQQIAQEMVAHVELRVDLDSGARLVLNLVSEDDALSDSPATLVDTDTDIFASGNDPRKHTGTSGGSLPGTHGAGNDAASDSLVSEEELGDMLIDDNRMVLLAMGTKVSVHFENQVITASVANLGTLIDAAKIKSRNDFVYALIKVINTEDDQLTLTLNVMTNTATLFKRFARPAVVKGTILKISTALPSVIHADPELIYTFAQNMAANVRIVHSNRTGKNSLTIENVG